MPPEAVAERWPTACSRCSTWAYFSGWRRATCSSSLATLLASSEREWSRRSSGSTSLTSSCPTVVWVAMACLGTLYGLVRLSGRRRAVDDPQQDADHHGHGEDGQDDAQ